MQASSWLPTTIGTVAQNAYGEFLLLLLLATLCYLGAAHLLQRQKHEQPSLVQGCIWTGALLAGIIYIFTPGMLSHDILVYASYSRILITYHANPYFIPIGAYHNDPFTSLNYWSKTVSAYGPIWMFVCAFWGWLLKPEPSVYVIAFRVFALAAHLLNIWLVRCTLRAAQQSPRTVSTGTLLYAWNPLVLLESCLGGHNDVFMMTFVLLGIFLAIRAERRGYVSRMSGYLPTTAVLTLAVLVKFTALPILIIYLLFLVCSALRPLPDENREFRQALRNWRPALRMLLSSGLLAIAIALLLYGPFWLGHNLLAIVKSFQTPPSATGAQNSFLRSVIEWLRYHPTLAQNILVQILNNRTVWDLFNYLALAICFAVGARKLWLKPTTRTFIVISLAALSLALLLTPWFYPWYVTWIIGLAVVCLPMNAGRKEASLLNLTLVFSSSALLIYLSYGNFFVTKNYLVCFLSTVPPICAFLLTLVLWRPVNHYRIGEAKK